MNIHYYMMCFRSEALVASHLEPEAFGHYMAVGTRKLSRGNVLFFEIDPGLKNGYFRLSDIGSRCIPHEDGSPKRSKYISVYRVMEHIELNLFLKLYLTTADGRTLTLDASPYDEQGETRGVNLYQELCPLTPLVASLLAPAAFTQAMTDPNQPVNAPRLFFADLLTDHDEAGHLAGYLPYSEPAHIADCIKELERKQGKPTKTVARTPVINAFFRTIRRGFFLGDQTGLKYYRFPALRDLETLYARWWRSASAC
jgi:hypothetical protein